MKTTSFFFLRLVYFVLLVMILPYCQVSAAPIQEKQQPVLFSEIPISFSKKEKQLSKKTFKQKWKQLKRAGKREQVLQNDSEAVKKNIRRGAFVAMLYGTISLFFFPAGLWTLFLEGTFWFFPIVGLIAGVIAFIAARKTLERIKNTVRPTDYTNQKGIALVGMVFSFLSIGLPVAVLIATLVSLWIGG